MIASRIRPERERLRLRIPYGDGRAIAAARAGFRILAEEDRGDSLLLTVAGERKRLGPLERYRIDEPAGVAAAAAGR